jgi:hypothetical protein
MYLFTGGGLGAVPSPAIQQALQSASASTGVPYPLLAAVANRESGFNPQAVGSSGEQGLMQIMPATGQQLGLTNPFDPTANATAGAKYLSQLYGQYGDWNTALIAYNEGPGKLASGVIVPASQTYANAILADQSSYGSGSVPDGSSIPADTSRTPLPFDFGVDFPTIPTSGGLSSGAIVGLAAAGIGLLLWAAA